MRVIVKVQLPIFTTDPRELALVYAKGKKNLVQQMLDPETFKQLDPTYPKAFFEAEWDGQQWKIGKKVAMQEW